MSRRHRRPAPSHHTRLDESHKCCDFLQNAGAEEIARSHRSGSPKSQQQPTLDLLTYRAEYHLAFTIMSTSCTASKLSGQSILLIGGTGGVGLAVARLLLSHNASIILSSSRQKKVDFCISTLQSEFPSLKTNIKGHACDLATPNVEDNIINLFEHVGTINHVVYMAGDRLPMLPLSDITLEKWQQCSQVRTIASILVAKHATNPSRPDHLAAA